MFRVAVAVLLALLIGGATRPPSKVEEARAAFKALPIQERLDVQSLLTVGGYWAAVANDAFGPKLMEAIQKFQADNNFVPTGILLPDQIKVLREKASPLLRLWGLSPVQHPRVGATLWVPKGLGLSSREHKGDLVFEGDNDAFNLNFMSVPNVTVQLAYEIWKGLTIKDKKPIQYEVVKDDFFVITTEWRGVSNYTRYQKIGNGVVGFSLSWASDSRVQGDRLVVLISDLFRSSVSLGQSRRPPLATGAPASDEQRFIVIASRTETDQAIAVAEEHHAHLRELSLLAGLGPRFDSIFVASFTNGRYGIVIGPVERSKATDIRDTLKSGGHIPEDSFVSDGSRLVRVIWTPPPKVESVATTPQPPQAPQSPAPTKSEPERSSGSGFFVTEEGHMLTNEHVAGKCSKITVANYGLATLVRKDTANDLAMIQVAGAKPKAVATFQDTPIRAGSSIFVVGYPLAQYLGGAFNITAGMVSSLSGLDGDTRYFQFTAPLQPGNSGGAVLDQTGKVVGIATAKLNDLRMLKVAGTVPQNVNFAIGIGAVESFVRATGITVKTEVGGEQSRSEDIADAGVKFSAQVICEQ